VETSASRGEQRAGPCGKEKEEEEHVGGEERVIRGGEAAAWGGAWLVGEAEQAAVQAGGGSTMRSTVLAQVREREN
jgi:hypothetical protein